jgi:hypothetical protein
LELPKDTAREEYVELLRAFHDTVTSTWPPRALPGMKYDQLTVFGYMLSMEMPQGENIHEPQSRAKALTDQIKSELTSLNS